MKRIVLLEIVLSGIAVSSGIAASVIGYETRRFEMIARPNFNHNYSVDNIALASEGGLDGGAVGLGIICASALISIVWIEITKYKLENK